MYSEQVSSLMMQSESSHDSSQHIQSELENESTNNSSKSDLIDSGRRAQIIALYQTYRSSTQGVWLLPQSTRKHSRVSLMNFLMNKWKTLTRMVSEHNSWSSYLSTTEMRGMQRYTFRMAGSTLTNQRSRSTSRGFTGRWILPWNHTHDICEKCDSRYETTMYTRKKNSILMMERRLSSDTVYHWSIVRDVYLLTVKSMPHIKKQKKSKEEIEADRLRAIEDFNSFALTCYDWQNPPNLFSN